jgi:8-oxo-dGTP diphosphatase
MRTGALVIQRWDNAHWESPGRILERGETITEGLLREVKEETGLIVKPVALNGFYKNTSRGTAEAVFPYSACARLTKTAW